MSLNSYLLAGFLVFIFLHIYFSYFLKTSFIFTDLKFSILGLICFTFYTFFPTGFKKLLNFIPDLQICLLTKMYL